MNVFWNRIALMVIMIMALVIVFRRVAPKVFTTAVMGRACLWVNALMITMMVETEPVKRWAIVFQATMMVAMAFVSQKMNVHPITTTMVLAKIVWL